MLGPAPGEQTGTVVKINGTFGFIHQDSGEADMFVMPASCMAFGGQLPPVGSRVRYTVVADEKTGRPRADGVEPTGEQAEEASAAWAPEAGHLGPRAQQPYFPAGGGPAPRPARPGAARPPGPGGGPQSFFRLQAGHPAPAALAGPYQPAPSRPHYAAGGAGGFAAGGPQHWPPHSGAWPSSPGHGRPMHRGGCWQQRGGRLTGTVLKISGNFGFIQQDSGEADMFVMPAACSAFASEIPPVGTRVNYVIVIDGKTGRPRADAVEPASGGWTDPSGHPAAYGPIRGGKGAFGRPQPYAPGGCWPGAVPGLPAVKGARQSLAGAAASASGVGAGPRVTGTMTKDHGSFGFISLDSGGPDMFVMPAACAEFGGVLPPLHTRLEFDVVTDVKTGRPRAEGVVALAS